MVTDYTKYARTDGSDILDWAAALGLKLDEQQRDILSQSLRRMMLMCCRQWGKSTTIALKAAHFAALHPDATVLVAAPSARQSEELLKLVAKILKRFVLGITASQTRIDLPNGARILALPNHAETIRGYSPQLLVIDEAAFLDDDMWEALFPMLSAVPGGGWLWLMSTPAQPTGFFYRLWNNESASWTRIKVTALECPRISTEMLDEARVSLSPADFAREYLCEFAQPATAAFEQQMIQACYDPDLRDFFSTPLTHPLPCAPARARPHDYLGVDLGRSQDPSAIAIVEFVTEPTGTIDPATRAPFFKCSLVLRHLESPPLGTPYTQVAARVLRLTEHQRLAGKCTMVVDAGGVGAPVAEMLNGNRKQGPGGVPLVQVVITGGREVGQSSTGYNVPKVALMNCLEHVLRLKKLRFGAGPLTEELFRQLMLLERVVKDSGNVTYSSPGSEHDDLVMAVALAVWRAWDVHSHYLKQERVQIVTDGGMMHVTHQHPLLRGVPPLPMGWRKR